MPEPCGFTAEPTSEFGIGAGVAVALVTLGTVRARPIDTRCQISGTVPSSRSHEFNHLVKACQSCLQKVQTALCRIQGSLQFLTFGSMHG